MLQEEDAGGKRSIREGEAGEAVGEGNSSGAGRKDGAREKKTLSPPIHGRIAADARSA